jgi:hypothetical protein
MSSRKPLLGSASKPAAAPRRPSRGLPWWFWILCVLILVAVWRFLDKYVHFWRPGNGLTVLTIGTVALTLFAVVCLVRVDLSDDDPSSGGSGDGRDV